MNRLNKACLLALSLLCGVGATRAQSLSLEQARAMALEANQQIQIAQAQSQGARHMQKAMRSHYLPRLSASAFAYYTTASEGTLELGRLQLPSEVSAGLASVAQAMPALAPQLMQLAGGIPLPPVDYRLQMSNSYLASLSLRQPLYTGGKITTGNRMADLGVSMAQLNERKTQIEVIVSTDQAYWQLVQAQHMHQLASSYQTTISELHRNVANAVAAGMRTRADLLRVEVEQGRARLQLERAGHATRLARMNLCQILGLPLGSDVSPTEVLPEEVEPELYTLGELSTRPELSLLDRAVDMRREQVKLTRSEFLPTIGLQAGYHYIRGVEVNDQLLLNNFSPSVLLSVNVPIFNWGEGRNKVRQARTEQHIAELQRSQLTEKMLLEQQQAHDLYREQVLAVELARTTLAQTQELLRQTQSRHDAGLDTTAELLEVQTMETKAKTEYIVAHTELALARTKLLRALGRLL